MPLPGLTESFYTLSSLLSQFYPLFHFILIGHSSLEHVCTLENLSVIPYHPLLSLSLTDATPPALFLSLYLSHFSFPFVCLSALLYLLQWSLKYMLKVNNFDLKQMGVLVHFYSCLLVHILYSISGFHYVIAGMNLSMQWINK